MFNKKIDRTTPKYSLELDLKQSSSIVEKVKNNDVYAQNLYAALCNNDFQKKDVWAILSNTTWSCSWRYAGGIISDIRNNGSYIDWYCSGIETKGYQDDLDKPLESGYQPESVVTEEIANDLNTIGWIVVTD